MNEEIEQRVYYPDPDDRIRIVIKRNGSWIPIFWFKASKDGSLYLGPRYKNVKTMKFGKGKETEQGTRIVYSEGEEILDDEILNVSKLSFHASGVIHSGGNRYFRDPLINLIEQDEICFVLFEYIDNFEKIDISKIRKKDICLNYPFDMERPISARLFASPSNLSKLVVYNTPKTKYQVNPTFIYPGIKLESGDTLTLQLLFSHGPKGAWPPLTYVVFPSTIDDAS